ncbi:MAG: cyclohexanecarboxylate--CoA ligase [Cryobacterium sp.]|jgi:cyclohexanecarboxylate-CoA ligase|nr:cyclohexanecarboxylate--CoA ligase [Cryobacterium sp.]
MSTSISERFGDQLTPLSDEQAKRWRAEGLWENRTLRSLLTEAAQKHPDRTALVGYSDDGDSRRMNYRELDVAAHHVSASLDSLGVGQGDGVVVMLPNWVDYAAFVFGINELGAVYAGVPVAYGRQQALAILRRSKARVLIIPRSYRRSEHLKLSRELREDLPSLEHVIVVDKDGSDLLHGERLWSSFDGVPAKELPAPDPANICYLGFTSGTTGEPKGAMHSHETLLYSVRQQANHIGQRAFGDPAIHLVASPIGHHTGFVWGVMLTTLLAGTGVYVDRWNAQMGVNVIRREGVTCFFGAPTFLQDMMRTNLANDPECPLECLVIAGSPVPRNLPVQAGKALGAYVAPAWGMTECSIVSSCTPNEPDTILRTDGSVFAGSEARIVDQDGHDVPTGEVGNLIVRGPGVMFGYFNRPDATEESFQDGIWFRTGDTASLDEHGWISLRGRTKDIIIRGGENIPVTEVESLIFDHPDVVQAALVGMPDTRLGERIGVVLVIKEGTDLTLDSLSAYLLERGLSRHYLPEEIIRLDEMPMTPSGKIKKAELRDMIVADKQGGPDGAAG